jgi:hypothetical protein
MPNDISLSAVAAVGTGTTEAKTATGGAATTPEVAVVTPPITNPTLRLDAALGLVVIEFRDNSGAITTSIPSQRQLEAYQRWETTKFGPAPEGRAQVKIAVKTATAAPVAAPAHAPPPQRVAEPVKASGKG